MTDQKPHRRTVIAYWKGYKKGYTDHADKEYDIAMFGRWRKGVAGPTEKNNSFNSHSRKPVHTCKT